MSETSWGTETNPQIVTAICQRFLKCISTMIEVLTLQIYKCIHLFLFFWGGGIVNEARCSIPDTLQRFNRRVCESNPEEVAVVQVGDDSTWTRSCFASFVRMDRILGMLYRANLQDWVTAVMLGVQDSPSSRSIPRFPAVNKGDTMTYSMVTDRSMRGQSFPGMKRSSVLQRLSLRWCTAQMSAKHSKMRVATWVLEEDGGKEEQLGVVSITVVEESMRCVCQA